MNGVDPKRPPQTPKPSATGTDSPWLWLAVFLVGGIVALFLTAPKYSWRQPQIEREYQARERAGVAISAHDGPAPLSRSGNPMFTLRPLLWLLLVALMISTLAFWAYRLRSASRQREP
jgi:hypothetical protein